MTWSEAVLKLQALAKAKGWREVGVDVRCDGEMQITAYDAHGHVKRKHRGATDSEHNEWHALDAFLTEGE